MHPVVYVIVILSGSFLYWKNISWFTWRSTRRGLWTFGLVGGLGIIALGGSLLLDHLQDRLGSPPVIVQAGVTTFFLVLAFYQLRKVRAGDDYLLMLREPYMERRRAWHLLGAYLSMALSVLISGFF